MCTRVPYMIHAHVLVPLYVLRAQKCLSDAPLRPSPLSSLKTWCFLRLDILNVIVFTHEVLHLISSKGFICFRFCSVNFPWLLSQSTRHTVSKSLSVYYTPALEVIHLRHVATNRSQDVIRVDFLPSVPHEGVSSWPVLSCRDHHAQKATRLQHLHLLHSHVFMFFMSATLPFKIIGDCHKAT